MKRLPLVAPGYLKSSNVLLEVLLLETKLARTDWTVFAWQAKKGGIEMEKHEAVVSGIMSSIGFDTLELSEQTSKARGVYRLHALPNTFDMS